MALFSAQYLKEGVSAREALSWAAFDFANSGYTTVVLTAVFNAYFVSVVCADASWATLLWTSVIAASNILAIVAMPLIGAASDLKANKKFISRFKKMEELADKPLTEYSLEEYDQLWKTAKKALN